MEKESPSHTDTLLRGPLWEEHVFRHQVEVMDGHSGMLPPKHVETQLDAQRAIQTNYGPFEAKANHVVKVVWSHRHLSLSNMKGVASIPPPLNMALHQGSARRLLQKKTNDRLKARLWDIAPSFRDKKIIPLHHLISASPTNIRG